MKLSIIIPVYNEEEMVPLLKDRLNTLFSRLSYDYEVVFVNDGSSDSTGGLIKKWIGENHRISLIELSRNFGHQPAITAGLSRATGDCIVILEADLQDPPEEIPRMVEKWKEGHKIVFAERTIRKEGIFRRMLFNLFYKMFAIVSDLPVIIKSGVYSLMDRVVVNHLINMGERNRFIPGMQSWVGFSTTTIYYERQDRKICKPRQTLGRLIRYALDAIFSFSYKPLRTIFFAGIATLLFFFAYGIFLLSMKILGIDVVGGFTAPTVAILIIGGLLLISNGIMGEYVASIYDEVKKRPLYIVSRRIYREEDGKVTEEEESGVRNVI